MGDEGADVADKHKILDLALHSFPVGDQFREVTKMMPRLVARCLAGLDEVLSDAIGYFCHAEISVRILNPFLFQFNSSVPIFRES